MEEKEALAVGGPAGTIPAMFWRGVRTRGAQTIYRQKEFGIWQPVSWTALGQAAREIGRASCRERV